MKGLILISSCLATILATGARAAPAPRFGIADLGTLPGGTFSVATALNNNGQVVGTADNSDGQSHAFLYTDGAMTDLGTFPGHVRSFAVGINDAGDAIGHSELAEGTFRVVSFLYHSGELLPLSPVSSPLLAYGINNAGLIVGSLPGDVNQAFVYSNGVITVLGSLVERGYSLAFDINQWGVAVGHSQVDQSNGHAALFADGKVFDLGVLPGGVSSTANAVNDNGVVTGYSSSPDISHAFLYRDGRMFDLGTLPGELHSFASDLNNHGQVVGFSVTESNERAFLYTNGRLFDLNRGIPQGKGWTLKRATSINDRGQIVGHGVRWGQRRAFLLSPIHDQPAIDSR